MIYRHPDRPREEIIICGKAANSELAALWGRITLHEIEGLPRPAEEYVLDTIGNDMEEIEAYHINTIAKQRKRIELLEGALRLALDCMKAPPKVRETLLPFRISAVEEVLKDAP